MMPISVTLSGGPFDGQTVEVAKGATLAIESPDLPLGEVARYKPRDGRRAHNDTYVFAGLDRVIARLPLPDEAA